MAPPVKDSRPQLGRTQRGLARSLGSGKDSVQVRPDRTSPTATVRAVNLPVNVSSETVVPSQGQLSTGEGEGIFLGSLHRATCKSYQDSRRERATGPSLCKPQTPCRPLTGARPGTSPPVPTGIPEHLQGSGPSPAPPVPPVGHGSLEMPILQRSLQTCSTDLQHQTEVNPLVP